MTGLIILGVIVLLVFLVMMIPVGADIAYEGGSLSVSAKVAGVLIRVFPRPPADPEAEKKEKKPKKEKPKKEKKEPSGDKPKKKFQLNFSKEEIFSLIKTVLKGLGKFRKMKVDRFLLHWTAAGKDPYNTAVLFGYVNASLSSLAPLCSRRFSVKDCSVSTDVNFTVEKMKLDFGLAISIRIGQIFGVLNTILFGALWILIKNKVRLAFEKLRGRAAERKAAKQAPAEEDSGCGDDHDKVNENEDHIAEERKDNDGK